LARCLNCVLLMADSHLGNWRPADPLCMNRGLAQGATSNEIRRGDRQTIQAG
jgi:hypothetical protein